MVLRGADTYKNLPNKTLRLLRYALAHPAGVQVGVGMVGRGSAEVRVGASTLAGIGSWNNAVALHAVCPKPLVPLLLAFLAAGYTHVMKTDDDCYVRIAKVRPLLLCCTSATRSPADAILHTHPSPECGQPCISNPDLTGSLLSCTVLLLRCWRL